MSRGFYVRKFLAVKRKKISFKVKVLGVAVTLSVTVYM